MSRTDKDSLHAKMTQTERHSLVEGHPTAEQTPDKMDYLSTSTAADKMAQFMKGKGKEWTATLEQRRPLRLLDLPVDVLKEIIKEVTHTNDLTSLALTHSALHDLTVPHIYSRFDIVWPETPINTEPRTGVDALTYGLSTLVMSQDVVNGRPTVACECSRFYRCTHCGMMNDMAGDAQHEHSKIKRSRRRGNNFAKHTRKFSLGNGPANWVQEYLISKESGKMLGTLVALAIARMPNLETFVWDMPTGILRDVFSALSRLGDCSDTEESRLEKIWIRWHDNRNMIASANPLYSQSLSNPQFPMQMAAYGLSAGATPVLGNAAGNAVPHREDTQGPLLAQSYRNVEHPNFSILPCLKSITVLDIDELAYLDELSVLIERSIESLRELRLGKAVSGFDQSSLTTANSTNLSSDFARSGGMLGMVMSKIYDCQPHSPTAYPFPISTHAVDESVGAELVATEIAASDATETSQLMLVTVAEDGHIQHKPKNLSSSVDVLPTCIAQAEADILPIFKTLALDQPTAESVDQLPLEPSFFITQPSNMELYGVPSTTISSRFIDSSNTTSRHGINSPSATQSSAPILPHVDALTCAKSDAKQRKLKLRVLELERISLSVQVLQKSIDWQILTSLTLLNCQSDERLWKALKRTFAPRSNYHKLLPQASAITKRASLSNIRKTEAILASDYKLKLRRIHTNNVTPALVAFLKEALAPNSLEWMFLQDGGNSSTQVTIDTILRGPLRRHRASLQKVMIDSSDSTSSTDPEVLPRSTKWKKWMFSREVLTFVTSGKMPALRELAMTINKEDWHFFLQRLPQIPHLRSLYLPHIAGHSHISHADIKDLALQIVDIVALRPDIELCYVGITTKCFEILEKKKFDEPSISYHDSTTVPAHDGSGGINVANEEDSDADDDEDEDEDEDEGVDGQDSTVGSPGMQQEDISDTLDDSDTSPDDEDSDMEDGKEQPKLRLREILFYDDKVSIFKARHGKL